MQKRSDHPPRPDKQPPSSELNPLLNPLLERHLGRWAEVYFTHAPEDRDAAVVELIHELKAHNLQPESSHKPDTSRSPEADLEWLRSKNLSLAYESDEGAPRWIWKVLALFLALVVAGFLYSQWKARPPAASYQPEGRVTPPSTPRPPAPAPTEATVPETPPAPPPAKAQTPAPAEEQTPPPKAAAPAPTEQPVDQNPPAAAGEFELHQAQAYLEGGKGPRDASTAADWLWRAVRRENPTAELLLADLYSRGDGVTRNCEQARLLLVAAAKRGQPQAAERLRELERNGCP